MFQAATCICKVKVRTLPLILNGLITSTMEGIRPDFKIAKTQTTSSCMFAPFKGTQEES